MVKSTSVTCLADISISVDKTVVNPYCPGENIFEYTVEVSMWSSGSPECNYPITITVGANYYSYLQELVDIGDFTSIGTAPGVPQYEEIETDVTFESDNVFYLKFKTRLIAETSPTLTLALIRSLSLQDQVLVTSFGNLVGIEGNHDLSEFIGNELPTQSYACNTGIPGYLTIDGTLSIDTDYCLKGQNSQTYPFYSISLNSGSKIIIKSGVTLHITNAEIRGCDAMWDAIEIEPGGKLILNDVTIRDAESAIMVAKNSALGITGFVNFYDNYIGINVYPGQTGSVSLTTFANIIFGGMNGLKSPRIGQTPFAGITLHDCTSSVILGHRFTNMSFSDLSNGIISHNSNFNASSCSFQNIIEGTGLSGYGIYATSINRTDWANIGNTTFSNEFNQCTRGIYLKGMNTSIFNNQMDEVREGIIVEQSLLRNIAIEKNVLDNVELHGIRLTQNNPCRMRVYKNRITMPDGDDVSHAIKVSDNHLAPRDAYKVIDNTISLGQTKFGIGVTGTRYAHYSDNIVSLGGNYGDFGLRIHGAYDVNVNCNLVSGRLQNGQFTESWGLQLQSTPRFQSLCNTYSYTEYGAHILDFNGRCHLKGNVFTDHAIGTLLGGRDGGIDAFIDVQNHHGNTWFVCQEGNGPTGAQHNSESRIFIENQRFFVAANPCQVSGFSSTLYPKVLTPYAPLGTQWFRTDLLGTTYDCEEDALACEYFSPKPPPDPGFFGLVDTQIVIKSPPTVPFNNTFWHTAANLLYHKLVTYPSLMPNGSMQAQWVDSMATTPLGKLYAVDTTISSVLIPDTIAFALLQEYWDSIESVDRRLNLFAAQFGDSLSLQDSLDLLALIDSLLLYRDTVVMFLDSTLQVHFEEITANLAEILQLNAETEASNISEQNQQMVNEIFLSTIASGIDTFTIGQLDDLYDIAFQCAYEGGHAVYQARALLALSEPDLIFEDEVLCSQDEERYAPPISTGLSVVSGYGMEIIPNPTSDRIQVKWDFDLKGKGRLQIFDLSGRLLNTLSIKPESHSISVQTGFLEQGTYFLCIHDNQGVRSVKTLIIRY